jgi:hypothetical protein
MSAMNASTTTQTIMSLKVGAGLWVGRKWATKESYEVTDTNAIRGYVFNNVLKLLMTALTEPPMSGVMEPI